MTTAEITASGLSETEHSRQLRRALIASTVGTTIEWYDFLLYGQVTGLVFGKLFFPQSDPLVGVLQAFAVFFVGFLGRPIGAAIFGHWGDRIGRKATLIATLLVTGLATMAVGLVPTYESIGIWGAVLLVIIRLIQGIGVGGEWGGSVLKAPVAGHHRSACSGVKALRNTSHARRQAAKLCYRFGPLTPSARSANLIAGDGTKNGFPATGAAIPRPEPFCRRQAAFRARVCRCRAGSPARRARPCPFFGS
jgi:hypothetical protein